MNDSGADLDRGLEADELFMGASAAAPGGACYACGRYVLEVLTGRSPGNILIACGGDTASAARRVAQHTGLLPVPFRGLEGGFQLAAKPAGGRSLTLVPLTGQDISAHLGDSGFTVEALGVELGTVRPRELIDPHGGMADLADGRLRAVSAHVFDNDPARLISAAGLAATFGLGPDPDTEALMREKSGCLARLDGARAWSALRRLFSGRSMSGNARFLQRSGTLTELLPEVGATYDVPQNYYHHLGVWEHTLEVLDILEQILEAPEKWFPAFGWRVSSHLRRPLDSGVDRRSYLGFAALIHDIGKPGAMSVEPSGRIRFQGHQDAGARLAADIAARLGLTGRGRRHLELLVRDHMRLGFLLKEGESARTRLAVVDELGDHCIEVILLSLADRLATRGEASTTEGVERYRRMASRVMHDYFWDRDYPPLVSGRDVMVHTGIRPGPPVAEALFRARVAQREALVSSRQQALEYLAPDFKGKMNVRGRAGEK